MAQLDLKALLPRGMQLMRLEEMDASGTTPLSQLSRLDFVGCDPDTLTRRRVAPLAPSLPPHRGSTIATLQPMDLRTYRVEFKWRE